MCIKDEYEKGGSLLKEETLNSHAAAFLLLSLLGYMGKMKLS